MSLSGGESVEYPYPLAVHTPPMEDKDVRQWCMLMHLSQFAAYFVPVAGIVVPVVMWQTKKQESPEIDAHGRMIVNAIICYVIYMAIAIVLSFVLIGIPLVIALGICAVAFPVIGAIKANDGVFWRYPLVFDFV
jgi:uncharacterized Tic20 family protein